MRSCLIFLEDIILTSVSARVLWASSTEQSKIVWNGLTKNVYAPYVLYLHCLGPVT